jgi:UDP-N-acetylmuramate: L-alanyl-gamma-D-glutamyl-meso-diaminopimelate ligase
MLLFQVFVQNTGVKPENLYFIAVGGTAMAPLAVLLAGRGHRVAGSDASVYPPMSNLLAGSGVSVLTGFRSENVPPGCDRVVIGNAVPRGNPEVARVLDLGLPYLSLPQAVRRYLLAGKHSVVVTGTHGKTTTSALLAWLLTDAGLDPGFLIGGELKNFGRGFRDGAGPHFLLEGDEYNAAFFDRGPKFLHYEPRTLLVNNIEFDHSDLYADLESIRDAFRQLVALVPSNGTILANLDDANVVEVIREARARVVSVGVGRGCVRSEDSTAGPRGASFTLRQEGSPPLRLELPLFGSHNLRNALMAVAAARALGVDDEQLASSLPKFAGVKRRLEVLGKKLGVLYVDDFAHHPTAVFETLSAARTRWPNRRIWGVFEPRSITAGRSFFQSDYERAFEPADAVVIAPVFHATRFRSEELIDREKIVRSIEGRGKAAYAPSKVEQVEALLEKEAREGDVVILMSSGDFAGLRGRVAPADQT